MVNVVNSNFVETQKAKKWSQVLVAGITTISCFTTGCHSGWPTPSFPKLLSEEYPFEVSNDEASYMAIIGILGNIIGGFVGSAFIDRIGRKKTILFLPVPQLIALVLIVMSYQIMWLLYAGRFIGGLSEGITLAIVPLYLSEIAEPSLRGRLSTLLPITFALGLIFINLLGSYMTIKDAALVCLIFPIIFAVFFWKMPETPYFLLMKHRDQEAEKVLHILRRRNSVGEELANLIKDVNRQMSESGKFSDIFLIKSNRKGFLLLVGARIFQVTTGIVPYSVYMQVLLGRATQSIPSHLSSTIVLTIQFLTIIITSFFVDKWGRRPLLFLSTIVCFVNLLLQTIYFILKEQTNIDVLKLDWFPLVMLVVFNIAYAFGLGTVLAILSGEIFSVSIKSKAISLTNVAFGMGNMASTKFYQTTADQFGMAIPFGTFTFCTLLGAVFFYVFLPETKGKTLEQIQQYLKGNTKEKAKENTVE